MRGGSTTNRDPREWRDPDARRARRVLLVAVGALLLCAAALLPGRPAGARADSDDPAETVDELDRERDAVRDQQDQLAESLDVLRATDEQVEAALDQLDAAIAEQEATLDEALARADAAAAALHEAKADLRAAEADVEVLREAIREMAVAAYIHPPSADLVQSLGAETLSDAVLQQTYLDARARRDVDLLSLLEQAEARARRRADVVADAAAEADRAVDAADAALADLEADRAREQTFASDLHVRIDGALAEAAALADLDAELSDQIAEEQAALLARIPPPTTVPPTTVPPTTVPAVTTTTSSATERDDETADADTDAATDTADETDETDQSDDDAGSGTTVRDTEPPPLATVWGFTVHAAIADDVSAMFEAADADGFSFGGSGYRSTERQIELRRAHCGPTDYDIWEKPAGHCSPPTAVPGRSLHEQGRALDLTFEGRLITSRDNAGFQWLAEHAAGYGLFNLPSEPWHWSTNGN